MAIGKEITENDLDFYLTIIAMFCAYNESLHFSDKMFADITSDIVKRDSIIEKIAEDGYITAKKSNNIPHRYTIEITSKGIDFKNRGGYIANKNNNRKQKWQSLFGNLGKDISIAIISAMASAIITLLFTA